MGGVVSMIRSFGSTVAAVAGQSRRVVRAVRRRLGWDLHSTISAFTPCGPVRGRILLAHRIDGFVLDSAHPRLARHNQFHEAIALTEALLERGFAVDVVSHRRERPTPRGDYDLFVGTRGNFEMLASRLDRSCIRVVALDTTHWLYNNHASLGRSLEVQNRRGITPERDIAIERNRAIEAADYGLMLGNDFVYDTYAFAGTPIFELINPTIAEWDWPKAKDHGAVRKRFLWLSSRGLAHKGLGRVLEAFGGMPDLHLTVCGPLEEEPNFCRAYERELRHCRNIEVRGWIDVTGPDFTALADSVLAHIFPSCAEAQAGSVINCMGAGLIPMVSREVGLDVSPRFGIEMADPSVQGIRDAVRALSDRPAADLQAMARQAWLTARTRHSRARYKTIVGSTIERILRDEVDAAAGGFIRLADRYCEPELLPERPPAPTRARQA